MNCNSCNSIRIASVRARCKDMFNWKCLDQEIDGYVHTPGGELEGTSGGDYLEFKYCLECGKIQSDFPVSHMIEDDDDWDMEDYE